MKKLFDEIPTLENQRLVLQKLNDADSEDLRELAHDRSVYRYLPTFLFEQKYEDPRLAVQKLYTECFQAKESLILGIFLKDTKAFCGLAEFYGFKDALHKTCVGYRLAEKHWGHGIATEAVALMVDYLFSQTDIRDHHRQHHGRKPSLRPGAGKERFSHERRRRARRLGLCPANHRR
ncbi:MAG: GNAT family N-acetyltransferase [Clostridia bacterium]|nr:GNAT family N-acetyltransferase [Clostridia bacterium]